jgi:hypothetical protein
MVGFSWEKGKGARFDEEIRHWEGGCSALSVRRPRERRTTAIILRTKLLARLGRLDGVLLTFWPTMSSLEGEPVCCFGDAIVAS